MALKQIRVGTTVTVRLTGKDEEVTGKVYLDEEGTRRICGSHDGAWFDTGREHWRNADGSYHDCDGINVTRDAEDYFPSWVIVERIGK